MLWILFYFRTINAKEIIGLSTIYKTYLQIQPKDNIVRRTRQCNMDTESSRYKARFCLMKQLAIRFGKLDPTKVLDPACQDDDVGMGNQNSCKVLLSILSWGTDKG